MSSTTQRRSSADTSHLTMWKGVRYFSSADTSHLTMWKGVRYFSSADTSHLMLWKVLVTSIITCTFYALPLALPLPVAFPLSLTWLWCALSTFFTLSLCMVCTCLFCWRSLICKVVGNGWVDGLSLFSPVRDDHHQRRVALEKGQVFNPLISPHLS